ncbi:DUF1036 domain-containing protein [Epibacterium sp. SM1979]|uniref:DUF1036 domain-containing protein n=1 Tax=Tritonibacter litoralis TaxID=2662264 RepID=A0A843YN80_9RHOB|nr:DUF1036 domain-containing protein [Tritonibacter litoralis]MQQ10633.1 DUF1036 domain-containing protein [Tritonibacter litoralis]
MSRRPLKRRHFFVIFTFFLTHFPQQTHASLRICNQTLDVVNIAIGQWDLQAWVTSGWWVVGPNQCADVIETDLTSRFVYVYAQDVFRNPMFEGDTAMCVDNGEFRIESRDNCLQRGKIAADFREIDTGNSPHWTFNIIALQDAAGH